MLSLVFCAWKILEQAKLYQKETIYIIDQFDPKHKLNINIKSWAEKMTFGLYGGYSKIIEKIKVHRTAQSVHQQAISRYSIIFLILIIPTLLFSYFIHQRGIDVAYTSLGISLIALVIGLTAPILAIVVNTDIPVLGETVLQYKSKGIFSTIEGLWHTNNHWIATLLFIFSVVIPITKSFLVFITLFAKTHHWSLSGLRFSHHIGKWSMADVFVVSTLLVFFANEGNGLTDAEIQVGLFFFTIYVILSLLSTQVIAKSLSPSTPKLL